MLSTSSMVVCTISAQAPRAPKLMSGHASSYCVLTADLRLYRAFAL